MGVTVTLASSLSARCIGDYPGPADDTILFNMTPSRWQVEERGAIVIAAHDNAPMNYLNRAGARELSQLVDTWRADAIRAVVITSAHPGRFITHYSVEELLESQRDRRELIRSGAGRHDGFQLLLQRLNDLAKPVIVAMNGDTMGGGFELALACDIRVAQHGDFRYGLPEVRLGILPGGSGTQRLARLLGPANAIDFCMRGRLVTPERALQLGLVHELVEDSYGYAVRLAEELAALPPVAVAMIKRAIYAGSDLPLAGGLRVESDACFVARLTDDATRAMEAYVETPLDARRDWLEAGPLPRFTGA